MEVRDAMTQRWSCRQFRPDPIPPEDLREMVRFATLAPNPANAQPWKFVAVTNRDTIREMAQLAREKLEQTVPKSDVPKARQARDSVAWYSTFYADAPAVIAATMSTYRAVIDDALEGDPSLTHDAVNEMRMRPDIQCIGAAVENLLLAAVDMGYAGCWVSGPLMARARVERLLDIRPPHQLIALVALGKPAVKPGGSKQRRPLEEVFELRV
jgi:nitroreductase